MRSMYGSWFPAVSTQMLYGFRSRTKRGVLIGEVVFHGRHDRQVGVDARSCCGS